MAIGSPKYARGGRGEGRATVGGRRVGDCWLGFEPMGFLRQGSNQTYTRVTLGSDLAYSLHIVDLVGRVKSWNRLLAHQRWLNKDLPNCSLSHGRRITLRRLFRKRQ